MCCNVSAFNFLAIDSSKIYNVHQWQCGYSNCTCRFIRNNEEDGERSVMWEQRLVRRKSYKQYRPCVRINLQWNALLEGFVRTQTYALLHFCCCSQSKSGKRKEWFVLMKSSEPHYLPCASTHTFAYFLLFFSPSRSILTMREKNDETYNYMKLIHIKHREGMEGRKEMKK